MPDQTAGTPVIVKYIDFFPIANIKLQRKKIGMIHKKIQNN